jgi:uncharacterized protein (DUF2336 family)
MASDPPTPAPLGRLVDLARDTSDPGRAQLLLSTAEAYRDRAPRASGQERDLFVQVATQLLARAKLDVRVMFSERVADADWAPRALVLHLALDELPVAEPIIKRSPVLDDGALIEILNASDTPHRCLVAARKGLGAPVARALIERSEPETLIALARNLEAKLDRAALAAGVAAAQGDPAALAAFVERLDLPPDVVRDAYVAAGEALRERIAALYDVDARALARAAAEAAAAAAKANYSLGSVPLDDIKAAVFGAPTPGALLRLLLSGQRAAFEEAAANALGLSLQQLRAGLAGADPKRIALLARSLGFDLRSTPMLHSELLNDGGRGWTQQAEQDARFIYTTFRPEDAVVALREQIARPPH